MNDVWTVKAALDWTVGYLGRKGDENPRLSAEWLISEATGLSRIELYVNFDRPLSLEERDALRGFVTRRGKGEPLQYITGEVSFRHITLAVRPGVLIPRPETEVLVSEGLSLLPAMPRRRCAEYRETIEGDAPTALEKGLADDARDDVGDIRAASGAAAGDGDPDDATRFLVADICTGSGCIACSVAFERPDARVIATDISPDAVKLARDNARSTGVEDRVQIIACDLGEGVDPALLGAFDLVISNPPYIPTAVLDELPREVAGFEPSLALDGGADGLSVCRRLLAWCIAALKPGGHFAFELHETCLDAARDLALEAGFVDANIASDLAGRPRVLTARKPLS